MRQRTKAQTAEQLNLFVPLPQRPTWERLPPPLQRRVSELIAKLLDGKQKQHAKPANAKEATDA